jgi:hypothetical protein
VAYILRSHKRGAGIKVPSREPIAPQMPMDAEKGREILDMGELSRAVMASEREPTVMDFAPPSSPHRIQRVAELTGASIRRTCADAGRAVIELVDQADAVVRQLREDANAFVQSLDEIGNAHAARIEIALTHFRGLVETIGAERRRIIASADTHQTGGNEQPGTSLADASENSEHDSRIAPAGVGATPAMVAR